MTFDKRVMTRVEDDYLSSYFTGETKNVEYGDSEAVKELILKAYDFNLGGSAWADNDGKGNYYTDKILYYTYTLTPTNKQVIINDVVFKNACPGGWYRTTAKVNQSLTFDYE